MKMKNYLFLMFLITSGLFDNIYSMEPVHEHIPSKFHGLRITLRSMVEKLPALGSKSSTKQVALDNQLLDISSFIQGTLIDPGNEIKTLIESKGLANALYDIAQKNRHRATMNWLALSGLVNFHIQFKNDSSYELIASDFGRIQTGHFSLEAKKTNEIIFPLIVQGYGVAWGKFIQERILTRDEVIKGIVGLNLPRNIVVKISINLSGVIPPYILELSYAPLRSTESKESHRIESADPLDLFPVMQKHQLTASTCGFKGSYLTAVQILNWPDAAKAHDQILNETAITKLAGRYKKKDIYRYILNLSKDNYTVEDIQQSFDSSIQEMGKKHVPGWGEYIKTHQAQLGAGPFAWFNVINTMTINKQEVVSQALRLLEKAYRNLMIDKGAPVKK